MTIFLVFFL